MSLSPSSSLHILLLTALLPTSQVGSPSASSCVVRGRVVDVEGRPVAGIDIRIGPAEGIHLKRSVIAGTDEEGRFSFDVGPGRYGVNAYDESRGYLNSYYTINGYNQKRAYVILDLSAGDLAENVLIETTPIAGRLRILVIDDKTGAPIISAGLRVALYDTPEVFITHSVGHVDGIPVERLVPADVDLELTVSADGYQEVTLEEGKSERIRFKQGEFRSMAVGLKRAGL